MRAFVRACAVVIEGMGRAVHTNYHTRLQCDVLKLAMIKNQREYMPACLLCMSEDAAGREARGVHPSHSALAHV